jgi:hypothetical protein
MPRQIVELLGDTQTGSFAGTPTIFDSVWSAILTQKTPITRTSILHPENVPSSRMTSASSGSPPGAHGVWNVAVVRGERICRQQAPVQPHASVLWVVLVFVATSLRNLNDYIDGVLGHTWLATGRSVEGRATSPSSVSWPRVSP